MSDRAALLASIRANPDDDTARLVYADWLDEHGTAKDARRAAHIRAAVDYHRRKNADTEAAWVARWLEADGPAHAERIKWARQCPELHELELARRAAGKRGTQVTPKSEALPDLDGVTFSEAERGFFRAVHAEDGATLLKHADAAFGAAPITKVHLSSLSAADAREVVARGILGRVRALDLNAVEPAALGALGAHPDAAGVRELDVDADESSPTGLVESLARGEHWTGLRRLDLQNLDWDGDDEEVEDRQAAELFGKPAFSLLRELVIWGNGLGNATARAIASGGMPELRFLDIAINNVTESGAQAIARAKGLRNLRFLDLATNDVEDGAACSAVIISPRLEKLSGLRIGSSTMAAPVAAALAGPSRAPTLRALDIDRVSFPRELAAALGACPATRGLWHLSLSSTDLTTTGFLDMFKGGGLGELVILDLHDNKLTLRAARAIADRPPASLQWLDVSGNPLTPDGLRALADSPSIAGLQYLCVSGSGSLAGIRKLKKRLGKKLQHRPS